MSEQDQTPPATPQAKREHKAAPAPGTELRSPLEHAKAIGAHKARELRPGEVAVHSVNGQPVDMTVSSWQHNAAAALHGWNEHEHHEAEPLKLSLDDYKKALLAASAPAIRAVADVSKSITVKPEKGDARTVSVSAGAGDVIDTRKLGITTYDLANAGISFTAAEEPHPAALSKHAAHVKNAEAAKQQAQAPAPNDDSHLFAKV
jgi:hypothetical protein